jgi:tetratricopeptide (TPR) repeat protein
VNLVSDRPTFSARAAIIMARKVNTAFLIVLTVLILGLAVIGLIVGAVLFRDDPQAYIQAGQKAMAAGDYEAAEKSFSRALEISPRDASVWLARGDAYNHMTARDPDNIKRAQLLWNRALEIEPANRQALERLTRFHYSALDLPAGENPAARIQQGRDYAVRLAQVAVDDPRAAALPHLFTIRGWLWGVEADPQKLDDAIAALTTISQQIPSDADLPYYIARAHVHRAQAAARLNDRAEADRLYTLAANVMDAAIQAQPDNPAMHARAAYVFSLLSAAWDAGQTSETLKASYLPRIREQLDRASAVVKPQDAEYVDIHLAWARASLQDGDRAAAETKLRNLNQALPDNQRVRLELADLLRQVRPGREQALKLLELPIVPAQAEGIEGLRSGDLEVQTLLMRADLRLDMASGADPEPQQALLAAAADDLAKASALIPQREEHPMVLRLQGKTQRIKGDLVAAIQTLTKAMALLEQRNQERELYETMDLLARCYYDSRQTGQARALLEKILTRVPGHLPSRLLMAQVLLRENSVSQAEPHIAFLEQRLPDAPDVIKLRLLTLDRAKDQARIRELLARLPEQTRRERLEKAVTAAVVGMRDESERLLIAVLAADPADLEASVALAQLYIAQQRPDQAKALVNEALKAHPDNAGLQLLQKQLGDASAEELSVARREAVERMDDPAARQLMLARLAQDEGKSAEALDHLQQAEQIKPNDQAVLESLLQYHATQRDWAAAEQYVHKLEAIDADDAGGLLYRHRLAMARGDIQGAVEIGRQLTQKLPEFAQSWVALAQGLQAAGQTEEAIQRYLAALDKQPTNASALRGLIECNLAINRPNEARTHIDRGLQLAPDNAFYKQAMQDWELAYGDPDKAIGPMRQATERNPADRAAWSTLLQAELSAARSATSRNDAKAVQTYASQAIADAQRGVAQFPDDRGLYGLLSQGALLARRIEVAEAALGQLAQREAWRDKPEPQLMLAEVYGRAGMSDQAESVLVPMVQKRPDNVQAQLMLAELLSRRGRAAEALTVLQANGQDPSVVRLRVELQILSGGLDAAEQTLSVALKDSPGSVDLLALSGYVHLARHRWDEATRDLQEALRLDPQNIPAAQYLAQVKLQQPRRDVDGAVALLVEARDRSSADVDIRTMLAQAYQMRNESEKAITELEAALQLEPTNKGLRLTLVELYSRSVPPRWLDAERTIREGLALSELANDPDLLRAEAMMWLARKDNEKALDRIGRAVAAAPGNPALLLTQLNIMLAARDYPGVIRDADRILSANTGLWWAYQARAVARGQSGDRDGAIQDFEAALAAANAQNNETAAAEVVQTFAREIGVDDALARIQTRAETDNRWKLVAAQLYNAKGDTDGAITMVEQALANEAAMSPVDRVVAMRFAGSLYIARRTPESLAKANDVYLRLIATNPDDIVALNNLAWLLSEGLDPPKPAEALGYSQRAYDLMVKANRREPFLLDTHGWMLVLNNRVDDGIDVLRESLTVQPMTEAHYHLAEAYLRKALLDDAQRQLQLASELLERSDREQPGRSDPGLARKIQDATERVGRQRTDGAGG